MTTQTQSTAPSNAERTASWSSRAARTIEQSIATALRLVRGSQDESQSVAADERQRQQARGFFVALADSKQHRAAIQSVGIRAFLKQADAQTDADFDRLWRCSYANKCVLEVGCRSFVRMSVFEDSTVTCLDPLDEPKVGTNAPTPTNIAATYAVPAERFVPALAGTQHLALCWNLFDHCGNWRRVLDHVSAYLRPGGRLILGVDGDVRQGGPVPVVGGGRRILERATQVGLELDYELPAAALSRDWAGVFCKREGETA